MDNGVENLFNPPHSVYGSDKVKGYLPAEGLIRAQKKGV